MTYERKDILTPVLDTALNEMQAYIQQGFEKDPTSPAHMHYGQFRIVMVRTELTARRHRERLQAAVDNKPVLTQAESLEKARAVKKLKQMEGEANA